MNLILETFKLYTQKYKWRIVPLNPGNKWPIFQEWTLQYNEDIVKSYFEEHPECNMGLLTGGIVDVESDSESGNTFLDKMIGDYPHPKWKSTKSVHHLFKNPEKYPRSLTRKTFQQKIEFRGFGHQSVLPPSTVADVKYDWLPGSIAIIPEMPKSLRKFYFHSAYPKKDKKEYWENK
jgi:hypothetical protein